MSEDSNSISEQYRIAAKKWVELDSAARMYEETKGAILAQKMAVLGDMPVSKAELSVKSSPEWMSFITEMVEAKTASNLAKVKLEWIKMRFSEQQSREATERAERKL